jgi:homopolymeric O-antigen transport system permease protein
MPELIDELSLTRRRSALRIFAEPFSAVWQHRALIVQTTKNTIVQKHAGSVFGILWIVLTPLLFLAIYATVYSTIFQIRPPDVTESGYLLLLISGLLAFLAFSEGLSSGTTALNANRVILLNAVFPPYLIPLNTVLTAHASALVGFAIVSIGAAWIGSASWSLLLVPLVLLFQVMFLVGLSWILSPIRLVFPDIQNLIGPLILILAIASPIAYTPQMVPAALKGVIYLNPLSYFVLPFQFLIVRDQMPPVWLSALTAGLGLAFYIGGYWWFRRISRIFADYV